MAQSSFESRRGEFPVTEKYIYLDHAGVAPVSLRVKRAIECFLEESAGGGAVHYPAWTLRVQDSRRTCAKLLNADEDEVAFVKNTSHGLSLVAEGLDWNAGDNVLYCEGDFPSNLYPWQNLVRKGVEPRQIPSRSGSVSLGDIERMIDAKTRLLAVSSVRYSNGFRIDLRRTGELCRKKNVLLCVDAIQSLGVIPMDVRKYHVDFLSADGHKWLLGPEGIGIFFCRKELAERLHPPLLGWKSVRNDLAFDRPDLTLKTNALRFEEGSLNLQGIFGLAAAVELLFEVGIDRIEKRVLDLGDLVIREAGARGLTVHTPQAREERGGNITVSGRFDPGRVRDVLREKGTLVNVRGGGLRISPHFYATDAEIGEFYRQLDSLIG